MMRDIYEILKKGAFISKDDIIKLLSLSDQGHEYLIKYGHEIKLKHVKNHVYLRGIIEFSNICEKNCYYCGIRRDNKNFKRYNIDDDEIIETIKYNYDRGLKSFVLQSGEITNKNFIKRISNLLKRIKREINSELRITLSLGEQSYETYKEWYEAGAQRYLLRIETSSEQLYKKLHPNDDKHSFMNRLKCLENIKKIGYQTGTGVMIGLPYQTLENLADDIIFMREFEVDMVGMGPYIEHPDTPLYQARKELLTLKERLDLTIRMISVLRIIMPDINIASTTALQAIHPFGREFGLFAGANVIMPNVTPNKFRKLYLLYKNKPCIDEKSDDCIECLINRVKIIGDSVRIDDYGDSKYYLLKKQKINKI